jgi:ABC-type transporter Mla subunit MlaD
LKILPGAIAQGLGPAALAAEIVDGVKEQFLQSGVSEAGRQLKEQGDRLLQVVSGQNHVVAELRQQLNDSRSHVTWVLNSVVSSADSAKKSIDLWNREMRRVHWIYLGLVLLIGVLLGGLFYWWVISPPGAPIPNEVSTAQQADTPVSATGRGTRHVPK